MEADSASRTLLTSWYWRLNVGGDVVQAHPPRPEQLRGLRDAAGRPGRRVSSASVSNRGSRSMTTKEEVSRDAHRCSMLGPAPASTPHQLAHRGGRRRIGPIAEGSRLRCRIVTSCSMKQSFFASSSSSADLDLETIEAELARSRGPLLVPSARSRRPGARPGARGGEIHLRSLRVVAGTPPAGPICGTRNTLLPDAGKLPTLEPER